MSASYIQKFVAQRYSPWLSRLIYSLHMPRVITTTVNSALTDTLIAHLQQVDGVLAIQRYPHASVQAPGDVLLITATNTSLPRVMDVLGMTRPRDPHH